MTWEKRRKTGARYFYRASRVGGRVVKQYGGSLADPVVLFLAREDRLSKAERRAQSEANADEQRTNEALESYLIVLHDQLRRLLQMWMRLPASQRQGSCASTNLRTGLKIMDGKQRRQPLTRDEFDVLVKRAEIGDAEALAEIRSLMRADTKTWRPFGDLSEHVKRTFLGLMVQGNIVARESLSLSLEELTRELQQGIQSPLRRLIIDQILILWLDVHYQQGLSASPREKKSDVEFLDRRMSKARTRYFEALEFLARMDQTLGLPLVGDSRQ